MKYNMENIKTDFLVVLRRFFLKKVRLSVGNLKMERKMAMEYLFLKIK